MLRRCLALFLLVSAAGCTSDGTDEVDEVIDNDGDGFSPPLDCNDSDPDIRPGVPEYCDGIDNDCDEQIDENATGALPWFKDADEDGFGDPGEKQNACERPDGFVDNDEDCNDSDAFAFPGADEVCNTRDDDCDTLIDEDAGLVYYDDLDGDGHGDPFQGQQLCNGGGLPTVGDDCNDQDASVYPGAPEICDNKDNNCDTEVDDADLNDLIDPTVWYADPDADGYGDASLPQVVQCAQPEGFAGKSGDCAEGDPNVNPGAFELCDDGIDNDCANGIDDAFSIDAATYYADADQDSFGDPADFVRSCDPVPGRVDNDRDCDDLQAEVNPATLWFLDTDLDGYGTLEDTRRGCSQPFGYAPNYDDCDDNNGAIYPLAPEICDGLDNDCGGEIDDGLVLVTQYIDADGDGYGSDAETVQACAPPPGFSANGEDCNDEDPAISPATAWYLDTDGDGWGDPALFHSTGCEAPTEFVAPNALDCDDADPDLGPSRDWYPDADLDGYGQAEALPVHACLSPAPVEAWTDNNLDCDDGDADLTPLTVWYLDGDSDGYGATSWNTPQCERPGAAYVRIGGDCDDLSPLIHPDMAWYQDVDEDGYGDPDSEISDVGCESPGDGYVPLGEDCDDTDPELNPDTAWYIDLDEDTWGNPLVAWPVTRCEQPAPDHVRNAADCDDSDTGIGPPDFYFLDADGDGYGVDGSSEGPACPGDGVSVLAGDCDDADPRIHPDMAWYFDNDGDGFGHDDTRLETEGCAVPGEGFVPAGGDCDEANAQVNPDTVWHADGDGDGLGDPARPEVAASCVPSDPTYAPNAQDCDDTDAAVGAPKSWFDDADEDGWGDPQEPYASAECEQPSGFVDNDEDCDDSTADIYPGMTWYLDADEDGVGGTVSTVDGSCVRPSGSWSPYTGDCAPADPGRYPGNDEVYYNDVDEDCDPSNDHDQDGDGVDALVSGGEDCNDLDAGSVSCGDQPGSARASCLDLLSLGVDADGPYWLDPDADGDTSDAWRGWCDMTHGGWTLALQNVEAVTGAGNLTFVEAVGAGGFTRAGSMDIGLTGFDFWVSPDEFADLGSEARLEVGSAPDALAHQATYTLTVDPDSDFALAISNEVLVVGGTSSGLLAHDGALLSTEDVDNDSSTTHCAADLGSPWWYLDCVSGGLFGLDADDGAYWEGMTTAHPYGALWLR